MAAAGAAGHTCRHRHASPGRFGAPVPRGSVGVTACTGPARRDVAPPRVGCRVADYALIGRATQPNPKGYYYC